MAGQPCSGHCTQQDPCFMNKTNQDLLYKTSCSLTQLKHKMECCAVRMEGSSDSPCHQQGDPEVSVDQMSTLLKAVEDTAKDLRLHLLKHDKLHLRNKKTDTRDSGYMSGIPENFPVEVANYPVQEEKTEDPVEVEVPSTSELGALEPLDSTTTRL